MKAVDIARQAHDGDGDGNGIDLNLEQMKNK